MKDIPDYILFYNFSEWQLSLIFKLEAWEFYLPTTIRTLPNYHLPMVTNTIQLLIIRTEDQH